MARSTNGNKPFVARRLLGPCPLPHIEFPFSSRCSFSKQYDVFCCGALQYLYVVRFSVTSWSAGGSSKLCGNTRCYLKLFNSPFAAFFRVLSHCLQRWRMSIPTLAVLSPLSLLSSDINIADLSPNLLYMWWRNKIS